MADPTYLNPQIDGSSSDHGLNGDLSLDLYQSKLWFNLNIQNNRDPLAELDSGLKFRQFICDLDQFWDRLAHDNTPSRTLSNLFWMALPWSRLAQQLDTLSLLDIGCGNGRYANQLANWSEISLNYHGLDVRKGEAWQEISATNPNCQFTKFDGQFTHDLFKEVNCNLFVSQSALEHVVHDLELFTAAAEYAHNQNIKTVHIHLVPSAACLSLYGLHGVRQYTPRTLSRITRYFPNAHRTIFNLGGPCCNELHAWAIEHSAGQEKEYWDKEMLAAYGHRLRKDIEADMSDNSPDASFYALIIETGVETSIFQTWSNSE